MSAVVQMDPVLRENYRLRIKLEYSTKHGTAFEEFFQQLMGKAFPEDFWSPRPYGKQGDRKCDGWLHSQARFFQVYAPMGGKLESAATSNKMVEDFNGAVEEWTERLEHWVFVHNASNAGIPPDCLDTLDLLGRKHDAVSATQWGWDKIRAIAENLDEPSLSDLLGAAASEESFNQLTADSFVPIIRSVGVTQAPDFSEIEPVPENKIEHNQLSQNSRTLIIAGLTQSKLVEQTLDDWWDPTAGDRIASELTRRYESLRDQGFDPDTIFAMLRAGLMDSAKDAKELSTTDQDAACLAMLAHFFEECDIFEKPPEPTA